MLGDLNFPPEDSSVKYQKMKQIYIYIHMSTNAEGKNEK